MDHYLASHLSQKLKIAPEYIIREFYEIAILQSFSETGLTKKMIFYGGTALRLAYQGIRFSEDLDFLMINEIKEDELKKILLQICKSYPQLSLVEVKNKQNTLFGLIKIKHPSLKHPRHIKIEISKKKNGIQSEYRLLHSECSHFSALIQTITLSSLEKSKRTTIKQRNEPRDWIDLWIICNMLKKPFKSPQKKFPFIPAEFRREMKRFLPQPYWPIIDQIISVTIHET